MRSTVVALSFLVSAGAAQAAGFTLTSPTIKPGSMLTEAQVFKGFGCEGKNTSPALKWSGAPSGTKSYAVTVYDPDAPTGSGWWHWVVYNIPIRSAHPGHTRSLHSSWCRSAHRSTPTPARCSCPRNRSP